MPLISAAQLAQQQQRMVQVGQRMDAQVDAKMKAQCPDYEPPEADMGDVNIYAGIHASNETLQSLADDLGAAQQTQTPAPSPSSPQQPKKKTGFMRKLGIGAGIAALAVGGPVAGGLVANYLNDDSDSNSIESFEVEAIPFDPNQ